jgi:hypothetical protein
MTYTPKTKEIIIDMIEKTYDIDIRNIAFFFSPANQRFDVILVSATLKGMIINNVKVNIKFRSMISFDWLVIGCSDSNKSIFGTV